VIKEIRRFLDERGYIEVETPMLTPLATGAAARPFETFHNALGIKLFARIAPELYLKRLVVGGFEKVYELNRNFRNEGISTKHNPEFTMLEYYWAYADVNDMMDMHEEMMRSVVKATTGGLTIRYGNYPPIDFSEPFQRITMKDAIVRYWRSSDLRQHIDEQIDLSWLSIDENVFLFFEFLDYWKTHGYASYLLELGASSGTPEEEARILHDEVVNAWEERSNMIRGHSHGSPEISAHQIAQIFEMLAEPNLIQPTFITDFPKPISPLSKASPSDPSVAERFEYFVGGLESANGFSELNDPEEQYQRFKDQAVQRERGDEEAMVMDEDYIRALSYGMPPAAGIGVGIDRLVMLLANKHSIRDVILFPHMRPAGRNPTVREGAESKETGDGSQEPAQ
jgi:lysyl-tRNA synthetase class 2